MIAWLQSKVAGYVGAAAAGGMLIGLMVFFVMDLRLDTALAERDTAKLGEATARGDLKMCGDSVARQNAAIEEMQGRAADQRGAYLAAEQARIDAEGEVARILSLRTPAGVSKCESASNMIADELRRERGQ